MTNLLDLTLPELTAWVQDELGEPKFRAQQLWQWLWQKLATDFAGMSNIAQKTRERLAQCARIVWPEVITTQQSSDGTTKFLLGLEDGCRIECVLIPSEGHDGKVRWALCLSTQVGCPMGCTFCATGHLGFKRNLTMAEILGQVLVARAHMGDTRPDHPIVRNLVFMGMGEPLLNQKEVFRALETLNSPQGLAFSPRRITVSTCGIDGGVAALGECGLAYLAVSLHAPNQELRAQIMPGAARLPLDVLLAQLRAYPLKTREHITFEYLLLKDVNDSPAHARELARLVHSLGPNRAKLNLIVYNAVGEAPYQSPDPDRVLAFERVLWDRQVTAIVRASKGSDIDAACGQLAGRTRGGESISEVQS